MDNKKQNNKLEKTDTINGEGNMSREDYVWVPGHFRKNYSGYPTWVNGYWKKVERTQIPHKSSATYSDYTSPSGSAVIDFTPSEIDLFRYRTKTKYKKKKRR